MGMRAETVVAKFKTHQYVLKTDSPNLMLTKFPTIRYTEMNVQNKWIRQRDPHFAHFSTEEVSIEDNS